MVATLVSTTPSTTAQGLGFMDLLEMAAILVSTTPSATDQDFRFMGYGPA